MVCTRELCMFHVRTELPTGGVGNSVISSYSGAMFAIGGSGVTFALSAVQDLVRSGNASSVTDIDIVWSIADPGLFYLFVPFLGVVLITRCRFFDTDDPSFHRAHFSMYHRSPARLRILHACVRSLA